MFLSPPLTKDLRFSGTPRVTLHASLDKPQSNLSAMLVDYGPSTQITRAADGISTPASAPSDCWGPSSTRVGPNGQVMDFDSCYQIPTKSTVNVTATQGWRISRGILDSNNRESLYTEIPVTPGAEYTFSYPILPVDYTIPAGHRVGVVLMANFSNLERNGTTGTTIAMNSRLSRISLPVVGGVQALIDAGAVPPVTADGAVGGTVPATLALTLGGPATFPAFTPGVDRTYDASTTATVTSSAGDATLSTDGGRLSNGGFTLAEPLQVAFSKVTWNAPTSNENVTIGLKQHIGANEPLRTGSYTKTLTFTLSTTSP